MMDLAPYVPVLDVPNALALIETVDVVSSKGSIRMGFSVCGVFYA